MLDVIARILLILGIVVLALLAVSVVLLLLALFFPVAYRIHGARESEKISLSVKAGWLFGLVRVGYSYPEPGRLTAKLLFFTLLNRKIPGEEEPEGDGLKGDKGQDKRKKRRKKKESRENAGTAPNPVEEHEKKADVPAGSTQEHEEKADAPGSLVEEQGENEDMSGSLGDGAKEAETFRPENGSGIQGDSGRGEDAEKGQENALGGFSAKIQKIKYTIQSICDKMREIWGNISYYAALLQEEGTKQLFAQTLFHTGKILKNIRPRHIKAEILFGTGSPDTTGYVYGIYCMAVPFLRGAKVEVTPDFDEAVLRGELEISGHVTLWVLVVNVLRLFFDKNLRRFLGRIKKTE